MQSCLRYKRLATDDEINPKENYYAPWQTSSLAVIAAEYLVHKQDCLATEMIDRSFTMDFETFKKGWLKMFEGKSEAPAGVGQVKGGEACSKRVFWPLRRVD